MWAYRFFTFLYPRIAAFLAIFQPKARAWMKGQQSVWQEIQRLRPRLGDNLAWIHVSSLGEYEQAKPLLQGLRKEFPDMDLFLTFFSPSGYEPRKNDPLVQAVAYLPFDSIANTRKFLDLVKPSLAVFVKYDLWYGYLDELAKRQVPHYLIAATFRPRQYFFRLWGKPFLSRLQRFRGIFCQDQDSFDWMRSQGFRNLHLNGDTRVDRVLQRKETDPALPWLLDFKGNQRLWVIGSAWKSDEAALLPQVRQVLSSGTWKILYSLHEIDPAHFRDLERSLPGTKTYYSSNPDPKADILFLDTIGVLAMTYRYADLVYIGGGFGKGIHNTLEPLVYENPLIFGPRYEAFPEAVFAVKSGIATSIKNATELEEAFSHLEQGMKQGIFRKAMEPYLEQHRHATQRILEVLRQELHLSTNQNTEL